MYGGFVGAKYSRAWKRRFRTTPNKLPWISLEPLLVTMLTAPPGAPPCSGEKEFRLTWNSRTVSWLIAERTAPELYVLSNPSIMNVLPRPLVPPIPKPDCGVGAMRRSVASAV